LAISPADFYLQAGAKLSQGDIVRDVPWGRIPDPVLVCRPNDQKAKTGKARYGPKDEIKDGGVAFANARVEQIHARAKQGLGVVLWHDCEIDKFEEQGRSEDQWYAAIAPVVQGEGIPPEIWRGIEAGERLQVFFLPQAQHAGIASPSYVDLRLIWSVNQSLLGNRVATLSGTAQRSLYDHLFSFLTHRRLRDAVICPSCLETISSTDLFDATAEEG
jgi:hypothetical protein